MLGMKSAEEITKAALMLWVPVHISMGGMKCQRVGSFSRHICLSPTPGDTPWTPQGLGGAAGCAPGSPIPASPLWEMLGRINKSTWLIYWFLEIVTFLSHTGAVGSCFLLCLGTPDRTGCDLMVALSPLVMSEEEPCVSSSLLIGIIFTWEQGQ